MRVLVAGDRGYIGTVLAPLLLGAGHEVVGLDAGWYDGCEFGPQPGGYESRTGDIREQRPEDLEGFDAVVNLAAISNDPVGHLNPEATYSVNAHGAAHLAQVAREAGVPRYVFSSSCSLYGAAGDGAVTEDSDFNPVTPYGQSKVMAEQLIGKFADDSFSPTYLRNATAYGSRPRPGAEIHGHKPTRGCVQTSSSTTSPAPRSPAARCGCRATARPGGPWSTPRTSHGRSLPSSRPSARSSTTRRSTSVVTRMSSRSAPSRPRSRSGPAPPSPSPRAPRRTSATTGSTSGRSVACCRRSNRSGRYLRASTSSSRT